MVSAKTLPQYWLRIQSCLFSRLEEELGKVTEKSRSGPVSIIVVSHGQLPTQQQKKEGVLMNALLSYLPILNSLAVNTTALSLSDSLNLNRVEFEFRPLCAKAEH